MLEVQSADGMHAYLPTGPLVGYFLFIQFNDGHLTTTIDFFQRLANAGVHGFSLLGPAIPGWILLRRRWRWQTNESRFLGQGMRWTEREERRIVRRIDPRLEERMGDIMVWTWTWMGWDTV
jgi:hypothetical protein